MKMNAKGHLDQACSELQHVQSCLNQAMQTVEKPNNKQEIQKALSAVNQAMSVANSACENYRD